MKKLFFVLTVIMISSLSYQITFAQKIDRNFTRGDRGIEELNLTDIQKENFNEIRFAHQETNIDVNADLKKNRLNIKKMMASKNIDETQLINLVENGSKLRAQKMRSKVEMWLAVYNILDDVQKEKWTNHFNNFGERGKRFRNDKRNNNRCERGFHKFEDGFKNKRKYKNNIND